ncbi:Uncharacterized protein dnm_061680 [Desulfonema magnum]|uniref:Uncharacterized protein n=1 Tax=Desulfonema magnum TaxID=45655 RepID=A0A975BRI5_9BACT|nr:Uncharacterized protein dnm_061680 [Desulfonema magnum]
MRNLNATKTQRHKGSRRLSVFLCAFVPLWQLADYLGVSHLLHKDRFYV